MQKYVYHDRLLDWCTDRMRSRKKAIITASETNLGNGGATCI